MLEKIGPIIDEVMNDVKRAKEATDAPPRSLTQRDRPPTAAIITELAKVLALCDQGLLQPPVSLTANGHRHVGETLAQACAVLARSRAGNGGGV